MSNIPSFDEYIESLGRLTAHVDPTASSTAATVIKDAAASLAELDSITTDTLVEWVSEHPSWVPALGLAVGLSQEKLKNVLTHKLGTAGWVTLARQRPAELISMLENDFDLVRLVSVQRGREYDFGDVLVARAGTRTTATSAAGSGRKIEDEIEAIISDLGLPYEVRTRFTGKRQQTAPCDLVIPSGGNAKIAIAAKGFDSTGSKLTDAVREIVEMAEVRVASQFIIAVIDGIGWKSRRADLKRIYRLWEDGEINGMYTLASLGDFRDDVENFARLTGLLQA